MIHEGERVAIIGGGLVGCYMALLLANENIDVDIYESRDELVSKNNGRSISININSRTFDALKKVGVDISKHSAELHGF